MRLAFRIELSSLAASTALCAAVALFVLPAAADAQQAAPQTTQAQSATLTEATLATPDTADTTNNANTANTTDATNATNATNAQDATAVIAGAFRQLAGNALRIPADGASVNDFSLDDQILSRQRGGAVGMLMVAATPQLMRGNGGGNGVTLWDEIAPPTAPLPVPVDAARSAQGNVASYQRK
ncbi:hypothetical protein LFL96_14465 [Paraburkholderia sp. D15]|uniref:hypothetical protein n=1 Tax=Paraburkholderia sp. D15 TaxID=2880218 RepID=UPI0024796316|nr:hypothetical protein [Paraburkholderia sp. D15]WGS48966.1 hypothetical protein LFL96_14465 [Paraburkholderia sp. D15]